MAKNKPPSPSAPSSTKQKRWTIEPGILAYEGAQGRRYYARVMRGGHMLQQPCDSLAEAREWRNLHIAEHTVRTADDSLSGRQATRKAMATLGQRTLADVAAWYIKDALGALAPNNRDTSRNQAERIARHPVASKPLAKFNAADIKLLLDDIKHGRITPPPAPEGDSPDARKAQAIALRVDTRAQAAGAVSDHTVYKYFCRISAMCNAAAAAQFIPPLNPTTLVARKQLFGPGGTYPKHKSQETGRRLTATERVAVFVALAGDYRAQRRDSPIPPEEYEKTRKLNLPEALPFFMILADTAMRPGELVHARWENVDWAGSRIVVPRKRHDAPQPITLGSYVLDCLRTVPSYAGDASTGPMWPGVTYARFSDAWARMRTRTGIENLRVYDLRHDRLSTIGESGNLTLKEFQAVSGHKTIQMLLRYWHADEQIVAAKLDRLGPSAPRAKVRPDAPPLPATKQPETPGDEDEFVI